MSKELEEGSELNLDFAKLKKAAAVEAEVMPVAVQHADTLEVLVVAYTNEPAMQHTIKTGNVTFWSTSRNELWEKGATSGETFELVDILVNCEQNSLLYLARPRRGGMCHTRNAAGEARSGCYYRRLNTETMKLEIQEP